MVAKIGFDMDSTDLNLLFGLLEKDEIEFIVGENVIYIHTYNNLSSIRSIMKDAKVKNYFITKLKKEGLSLRDANFLNWCRNKLELDIAKEIEKRHQKELRQMQENIVKAEQLLLQVTEKGGENIG